MPTKTPQTASPSTSVQEFAERVQQTMLEDMVGATMSDLEMFLDQKRREWTRRMLQSRLEHCSGEEHHDEVAGPDDSEC